ncbi:MAG TPA: hypothetical protein VFN31_00495, partial [Candidatus Saccharimonadales bacterium]|nr:hypothetical protein [Candidatus Saccharimonadales bacterium]
MTNDQLSAIAQIQRRQLFGLTAVFGFAMILTAVFTAFIVSTITHSQLANAINSASRLADTTLPGSS